MKIRITKPGVTDHSSILDVGTVIEIDDKNGASLVASEYAEAVEEAKQEDPTAEEMTKALDKKFKADELKAAATEVGVEFAQDATKAEVIVAVIEADKYADIMA